MKREEEKDKEEFQHEGGDADDKIVAINTIQNFRPISVNTKPQNGSSVNKVQPNSGGESPALLLNKFMQDKEDLRQQVKASQDDPNSEAIKGSNKEINKA